MTVNALATTPCRGFSLLARVQPHFRLTGASYQYSGQSSAARMIAIRIDPHITDARPSHRAAASSLSKSTQDSKTKRRLSG